jgi:putative addiction module component (TIGR02574 family)
MILEAIPAALRLNPREKRQLAEELWNTADNEEGEVSVDASILALLEHRLAAHAAHPQPTSTWDEVKQRIFGGHGA